ncbi:Hydantoinase B/oxoprolinase-domain-containing protein [Dimargaris cristalligena]|uniref:Hydantoinase B/oxoprolinase-domain-containing protein n=1 Tax=Dimargaris cristalligena TaxID=215637 RepID=A0A4V1J5S2_9FUNG|nr:Hydantoinase B/oxoprolinase-domain-containing protein [Dimargaris cristalligena]|eukprot:RKP40049.1 Hydantoinase B/oxoprolinase-domain-containing protein [Dimargaris cristalligena]
MAQVRNLDICIDRGGTFTDCYARYEEVDTGATPSLVIKLLSQDPLNYDDAPREGIRRILEIVTGEPFPRHRVLDTSLIRSIRMGTTVATNALLERRGERCALLITRGFKDLLVIGNQARPKIFELAIQRPGVLYETVVEINERVTLLGHTSGSTKPAVRSANKPKDCVYGISGELVQVLTTLDIDAARVQLTDLFDAGYRSIAVCFLHSYTYPDHERTLGQLAANVGFTQITLSHELMPMIKAVPRGNSACADAYLTPGIQRYLQGFIQGFDQHLLDRVSVQFMQSDGGLTPVDQFTGFRAILSGPAGGVVGCALTSWNADDPTPVVGFDMGGTSTDVSRYDGSYSHVFETTTAGITIQARQLDIHTVAAGGGSRLFFRNGLFVVGPESAGAHPGPACYRKSGPLTVTDANLVLGRLVSDYFPKIFGPQEDEPLDHEVSVQLFEKLLADMDTNGGESGTTTSPQSVDEVAYGFIKVANEAMSRPIRALTEARGYDSSRHILTCFGGAGGQHACAIADLLSIRRVLVHRHASILSAYGLNLADVVHETQQPCALMLQRDGLSQELVERITDLQETCRAELRRQGFPDDRISVVPYLNLHYQGTDGDMMTSPADVQGSSDTPRAAWDFVTPFESNYQQEFGFHFPDRDILVNDIRIHGVGRSTSATDQSATPYVDLATLPRRRIHCLADVTNEKIDRYTSVYFATGRDPQTPVLLVDRLEPGDVFTGPAVVIDPTFTVIVEPGWETVVTSQHLVLQRVAEDPTNSPTSPPEKQDDQPIVCDPIQLSVFSHRFMSIAEQMGRTLQKTAISTNIKERLDFSCAIFGPDGSLVANAPHIPVHLGSIGHAVQFQIKHWGPDGLHAGDVLLTNHPQAGGSHLPDMTVITPVFQDDRIVFFVASRGHHADIGGILPGSMPPTSRELYEEGAAFTAFKIVERGVFQLAELNDALVVKPAQYPKCSGTRCLRDNVSDLKAQIAANKRGIDLLRRLVIEYGRPTVHAYMHFIQDNAESAIRQLLRTTFQKFGGQALIAEDFLDNGARISLRVTIDPQGGESRDGEAVFDFTGTSPEVYGNLNAPSSITYSAVIYCLRCMVESDIPLNQGCLNPVRIILPEGSLLCPSATAAVVGGNVQTSQRIVDVIFKAFRACAASQGDMNNLTFGKGPDGDGWGYYETIAGGSGAGPSWAGTDGVHTHMTNTRITDPEILERRYPVILHEFSIRPDSGGRGLYRGGNGLIRDLEFLEPIQVSILSERRVFQPYGLAGGEPGQRGENHWLREGVSGSQGRRYRRLALGGKNTCLMAPHDRLRILTPGGGGWGCEPTT